MCTFCSDLPQSTDVSFKLLCFRNHDRKLFSSRNFFSVEREHFHLSDLASCNVGKLFFNKIKGFYSVFF